MSVIEVLLIAILIILLISLATGGRGGPWSF